MAQIFTVLAAVALLLSDVSAAAQETLSRRLVSSAGNVGVCYDPMHSPDYPLNGAVYSESRLRAAIDADFAMMASYVTHVRTYYSQYYGINVAQYANAYGIKLDLGVFMTSESWQSAEVSAAITAINTYPNTIETVLVGNENLPSGVKASAIIAIVAQIKAGVGAANAARVKFGTVQRITDYVMSTYDSETNSLARSLDILGVNIYPFLSNTYTASNPTASLTAQWNLMAAKFPASKMRMTETGFPSAGSPDPSSPNVIPCISGSYAYYKAVVDWTPPCGDSSFPKFWFAMFDRRSDDYGFLAEYERHFGFFTYDRKPKICDFPTSIVATLVSTISTISLYPSGATAIPAPVATPTPTTAIPAASSATTCVSSGAACGTQATGSRCCPVGEYCQPWTPFYYQCVPVPVQCFTPQVGVSFTGNEMATAYNLQSADCCSLCAQTAGCKAYTFVNSNADGRTRCSLKSSTGAVAFVSGAVSAIVINPVIASCANRVMSLCGSKANGVSCCPSGSYCQPWDWQYYQCIPNPARCSVQLPGYDFYGNDMGTVYGLSPSDCCTRCANTTGCKGYTFVNDNPGATACYLKRSLAGRIASVGVVSGVVN